MASPDLGLRDSQFHTVILAGERPGGSALSHLFEVSASVMVPVAGQPTLAWVIEAIERSRRACPGVICGPTAGAVHGDKNLDNLLTNHVFKWLEPAAGPAASALSAIGEIAHYPVLLTSGDHALLTPEIVDDFCASVIASSSRQDVDIIIGLVPHALVSSKWPDNKRTVLKFSDGGFCGSNLFAILSPGGRKALAFWSRAEADRKHPWRVARRFGVVTLVRYLLRRLSLAAALRALSSAAGCRIGWVPVEFARAAVDVDSIEDQKLAEKILLEQESARPV